MKTGMLILWMIILSFILPAQPVSTAQQVRALMEKYEYGQAFRLAEQSLATDSTQTELLVLGGKALTALFRFHDAELLFLRAWRSDTTNPVFMNELAGLYQQSGDLKQGIRWYRKILKLNPGNEYAILKLAALYTQTEEYKESLNLLLPLFIRDSASFYLLKQIAFAYHELKTPDSALIFYTRAHIINPSDPGVMVKIANLLMQRKAYDPALAVTAGYMKQNPSVYQVQRLNAYAAYMLKDYPGSVERFRQAIVLGDPSKFTMKYMGLSFYKLEKYDSAAPFFRKAFDLDTTDAEACFYYGVSASRSFNPDTGLCYLHKTLELVLPPGDFLRSIYSELAGAYTLAGKPDTALEILIRAHEADPGDSIIVFKIAYQYDYYLRKPAEALPYYEKFVEMKGAEAGPATNLPQTVSYRDYAVNRINELSFYKTRKKKGK